MLTETIFTNMLLMATLLCALANGLGLTFATVLMPGIGKLDDRDFLRAFQAISGTIQKNQPLFALVWVGSVGALLIATYLGFAQLEGIDRTLLLGAAAVYVLGVQLPTAVVTNPLNRRIRKLDLDALDESTQSTQRQQVEHRWNRWNNIRTACATVTSIQLLIVLVLL